MSDDSSIYLEAFNLLCNERIGYGMSRHVFDSLLLPDCVIKVERDAGRFQNVMEWEAWQKLKWTKHSAWFAACHWISPNGRVLVMEKTQRPGPDAFPERLPVYLTDTKRTNYGLSMATDPKTGKPATRFVCHDYGTCLLMESGMTSRTRKVDWIDA